MAETENSTEASEDEAPKGGKMKLIIIAVAALLVLGSGGGAAAYFLGLFGGDEPIQAENDEQSDGEQHEEGSGGGKNDHSENDGKKQAKSDGYTEQEHTQVASFVYVDLPDVLVNLQSSSRRTRYLKLKVALEVSSEDIAETVKTLTPRIMDSFQLYLRALTADEVKGSVGMQRLKAEMLARINSAIEPIRISDLLFKEMLVQ